MCEILLCMQLRGSLDAAFRGGIYEGDRVIGDWGRAVMDGFHNGDLKFRYPRNLIWHIAQSNLLSISLNCPCDGISQAILCRQEDFVRTTLILASRRPVGLKPAQPGVVLH